MFVVTAYLFHYRAVPRAMKPSFMLSDCIQDEVSKQSIHQPVHSAGLSNGLWHSCQKTSNRKECS